MKVIITVLFTLAYFASTLGLPAKTLNDDEVEIVPLERQNPFGDQPIVDTGIIGFGGPFSNPFSGLFENLEGIMTKMRQQMDTLLRRLPGIRGNSSEEIPDFPVAGPFPNLGEIDLSKGNTTSVTKVIDGHKVVINETEYKKEDDFGGTYFKVRIIDVKSDSSELTTNRDAEGVTTTPIIKDTESVENSVENEIPKSREGANFDNIETFDEVDAVQPFQRISPANNYREWYDVNPMQQFQKISSSNPDTEWNDAISVQPYQKMYPTSRDTEWNDVAPVQPVEDNSLNSFEQIKPIDLSRDTYVNNIMADAGAPIDPDAEIIFDAREPRNMNRFGRFINPR